MICFVSFEIVREPQSCCHYYSTLFASNWNCIQNKILLSLALLYTYNIRRIYFPRRQQYFTKSNITCLIHNEQASHKNVAKLNFLLQLKYFERKLCLRTWHILRPKFRHLPVWNFLTNKWFPSWSHDWSSVELNFNKYISILGQIHLIKYIS